MRVGVVPAHTRRVMLGSHKGAYLQDSVGDEHPGQEGYLQDSVGLVKSGYLHDSVGLGVAVVPASWHGAYLVCKCIR